MVITAFSDHISMTTKPLLSSYDGRSLQILRTSDLKRSYTSCFFYMPALGPARVTGPTSKGSRMSPNILVSALKETGVGNFVPPMAGPSWTTVRRWLSSPHRCVTDGEP
jgi:hypothetical protein